MGNESELTFDNIVKVRVPEYDVYIPELKTHGPVQHFMPTKIRNVVNMMERGLTIIFESKEKEMAVLTLVKQYSVIANSENERIGKEIYSIPIKTQELLVRSLNIKESIHRKDSGVNIWVNHNYTMRDISDPKSANPRPTPKKKPAKKIPKLYEFLSQETDPAVLPTTGFDDLLLS